MTLKTPFAMILPFILMLFFAGSALAETSKRVIVLGFDGMDPVLANEYMAKGKMPNLKKLAGQGTFGGLQTSMPPQSPVAWSSLITGMNPGGHGIFDFIARQPENYMPYLSTSRTTGGKKFNIGSLEIPFSRGETMLLRKGKAFWEILEENGIPATVISIPANFPPAGKQSRTLSGMGTPDINGTYGTFTFYTTGSAPDDDGDGEMQTGKIVRLQMKGDSADTEIEGLSGKPDGNIRMTLIRDPENPVALIRLPDSAFILKQGEWSGWQELEFRVSRFKSIKAICRFYLMQVQPELQLYLSPLNIDPRNPASQISTPAGYSEELAEAGGYYHTIGMPEDTKALERATLTEDAFIAQADDVLGERVKMLGYEMEKTKNGLLFVYFSLTDPVSHMFWRYIDNRHPAYDPDGGYGRVIENAYIKADEVIGSVMKRIDGRTLLLVVSDHGFGPYLKHFHLNRWLKDNNYLAFKNRQIDQSGEFFENVDFRNTKAYALGFNALYINQAGREGEGIVRELEKDLIINNLIKGLENITDPQTGQKIISKVFKKEEIYSGTYLNEAPDLLIGYNRGYNASWETAVGKVPKGADSGTNMKKWSGTHLYDFRLVPGIIASNRKIKKHQPGLEDIAPTILKEFNIAPPINMTGRPVF